MIHKQIALPEELSEQIEERAKRLQKSEEQVMRDLLSLGLGKASGGGWHNSGEALRTLEKLNIQGPADLAMQHDDDYRSAQP